MSARKGAARRRKFKKWALEVWSFAKGYPQSLFSSTPKGGGRMAEEKRKTKTSTAVKTRYNEKVYDVISARVPKELAAAFREKCTAEGIPQAQIIKKAIEDFLSR